MFFVSFLFLLPVGVYALPDSLEVAPSALAQVDRVDVHGGCENFYFMCSGPDVEGKFAAGYECYNTGTGFYSPTEERFDLKFDLPVSSKQLSAASVHVFVSDVRKAQELGVYLVSSSWGSVSCEAGGDICVQPYCGECKPLFDVSSSLLSYKMVGSVGEVSFDVTEAVQEAYSSGGNSVSLQVRVLKMCGKLQVLLHVVCCMVGAVRI